MNKIPLSEGRIKGNLKNLEQLYKLNYLPKEGLYCDKVELAILFMKGNNQEYAYRSIRFNHPAQIKSLIINCIKAYFLFSRQRNEITPENFRYKQDKFFKDIIQAFKV